MARPVTSVLFVVVVALSAGEPALRAAGRAVTFRAGDGRTLGGILNEASRRPAPAVVLVPMLGRSRDDWQGPGQQLADANITSLAIDLPDQSVPEDVKALTAWSDDIRAALGYLEARADVRGDAMGVAGASLGASLAAVAASDPRVHALVLISPSLDYRGLRIDGAMRQYGARPALLLASRQDSYAARSVRDLARDAPGPRDMQWSDAPGHGMALLGREPDLVRLLVEWFQRTLGG